MSDFAFIFTIFLIVLGGVAVSIFYIKKETKKLAELQEKEQVPFSMIKQDIENLRRRFETGYSQMAQELGKVKEIGRGIKEFQDFLKSPKLRGSIGEEILKDLLEQYLPKNNFSLQYQFSEGQVVDAVLKTSQGIIPIDSKFPMENFRKMAEAENSQKEIFKKDFIRDIKKHIDSIARKYILPQEGTVDFALMYIPSEPVYYEIASNNPEVLEYGYNKKVYFVSPNSFYYFLKIVMIGLEGAKIEQGAKKVLAGIKAIQQEALNFEKDLSVLTSHIDHAKTASERAKSRFEKLVDKIGRMGEMEEREEVKKLE